MRIRAGLVLVALTVTAALGGTPATALSGGPDGFGYVFTDSLEPDGPAYDFEDISATGTSLGGCDDCVQGPFAIGFSVDFYGTSYSSVYVSSNGFITFLSGQPNGCCSGGLIPSTSAPNGIVAGYWEDLLPSTGQMRYQTLGVAPARRFIVQFTAVPHYSCCNPVTMQFKLLEGSTNIEVHYSSVTTDGGTHTAGIENAGGTIGLPYFRASVSKSTTAVRYSLPAAPDPPVVTGPSKTYKDLATTLEATATDPNGHEIAYLFDWADGSSTERVPASGFLPSGTGVSATRSFSKIKTYAVSVRAVNDAGGRSAGVPHPIEVVSLPLMTGRATLLRLETPDPDAAGPLGPTLLVSTDTGDKASDVSGSSSREAAEFNHPTASGTALVASVNAAAGVGFPAVSRATSSVRGADVEIVLPTGELLELNGIDANSESSCEGSGGSTSIGSVLLGGEEMSEGTGPAPNTIVPVGTAGTLTLNEQLPTADGLAVTAAHLSVPGHLDLRVGYARSGISGCVDFEG